MGSFANSLFTVLLGWLQGAVSAVWNAFTSEKGNSFLNWIGNNWILIAAVLCVTGLAADLCVYLLRWKPMRVWKSFLTRNRAEEEPTEKRRTPAVQPKAYRRTFPQQPETAETRPEPAKAYETPDLSQWEEEEKPVQPERTEKPVMVTGAGYVVPQDSPYRRPETAANRTAVSEPEKDRTYRRPSETPREAYRRPAEEAERPRRRTAETPERILNREDHAEKPEQKLPEPGATPRRRTAAREESVADAEEKTVRKENAETNSEPEEKPEQASVMSRRRRRISVSDLFADPEEEIRAFDAPQDLIDRRKAYHEPVYPRGWKQNGDEQA